MANILGIQTVDSLYVLNVDADPSTGGGTPAPIGSFALDSSGSGAYYKTGALNTNWVKAQSVPTYGKVRVVYLLQDASDVTAMGGTLNNVYSTFQSAYDAANTLQTTLGGTNKVIIIVGNTTAATVGNVILTANWNENVWMNGLSLLQSEVGSITGDNAAGAGFSVGRSLITQQVRFSNIKVGNISVSATGAASNSGSIGIAGSNAQFGNLNTNITNVLNTTGNGGAIRFIFNINLSHLIIGNITTSSQATTSTAGTVTILPSTVSIGTIVTASNNLGGAIDINPFGGGTIASITVNSLSGIGIDIKRCRITATSSITTSNGNVSFLVCETVNLSVLDTTGTTDCTITNSIIGDYTSSLSGVVTEAINSKFTQINNLGNDSFLSGCTVDNIGAVDACINEIGTGCTLINTSLLGGSLSIDNSVAVTVKSDKSTFEAELDANITIELNGGVVLLTDDGAGNFIFDASLYKHALVDLTGTGGGANTVTFKNTSVGETYILYVVNTTGTDTLSITGAVYSGGSYIPTLIAGAVDRLLITYEPNFTSLFVATAGTNFS